MRLIDADTFKEYICNAYEQVKHMYPDGGEWARQITEDFCKDIDEQPTIDISNNSNTLGALDCIDRQVAIKALCREECGMDPKGCHVGTCYDVEIIEDVPSVQLELSNNSKELENKNGELISRQTAIEALDGEKHGL